MNLKTTLYGHTYLFSDIKEVLAKASEAKSGDTLAGLAASSTLERIAAKAVLADLTVQELTEHPSVSYEEDAVTRLILDDLDQNSYHQIEHKSIGELRDWILSSSVSGRDILALSNGMTSEVIAAISKLMGNLDLVYAGNKLRITAT